MGTTLTILFINLNFTALSVHQNWCTTSLYLHDLANRIQNKTWPVGQLQDVSVFFNIFFCFVPDCSILLLADSQGHVVVLFLQGHWVDGHGADDFA